MQLSDSTEGLNGQFGHIIISLGIIAVLVFCGFVSGSLIINIISWMCALKILHIMARIHIFLKESYCYTMNYEPSQSIVLQLVLLLVMEKDILQ